MQQVVLIDPVVDAKSKESYHRSDRNHSCVHVGEPDSLDDLSVQFSKRSGHVLHDLVGLLLREALLAEAQPPFGQSEEVPRIDYP